MGVEGVPDAAAVRRAVAEVAVVVVHGQVDRVPVRGGAAVDRGARVALAARGHLVGALAGGQALVPDGVHRRPTLLLTVRVDQRLGQVPVGGAGDVALAVALVAHGALVGVAVRREVGAGPLIAVDARVVGDRARLGDGARAALGEVGNVADARTGGAVVAQDAGGEVRADAGVLGLEEGEGVADRLAGAVLAGGAAGVVVHAVAPLVQEHGGDLAGVRAEEAAVGARAEEVDGAAVPVGVADVVDVHVGGDRAAQPGIARQETRRLAVDVRQVEEAGARRVRVARAAQTRRRAVGPAAGPEGEVPVGAVRERDRAALVAHPEVLAVQRGGRRAAAVGVVAVGVRDLGGPVRDVGEGQGDDDLGVGVGRRIDAARHLRVAGQVEDLEQRAGVGVRDGLVGGRVLRQPEDELPDQPVRVALARDATEGLAALLARGERGIDLERALVQDLGERGAGQPEPSQDLREAAGALRARDQAHLHVGDAVGAELDDVAVVDAEEDVGAPRPGCRGRTAAAR